VRQAHLKSPLERLSGIINEGVELIYIKNMKRNFIFIVLIVILLAVAGIWYIGSRKNENSSLSPSPSPIAQVTYICNGNKTIDAVFYKGETIAVKPGEQPIPSGSVKIILSDGRIFNLPQTISADGGRYANDDESFIFWSKGDGALIFENGVEKNYINCIVPAQNSSESPNP